MKNIEKYIIGILVFVAVGAIGTAVYFGVSSDKIDSKKEENNQEEVLKNNDDELQNDLSYSQFKINNSTNSITIIDKEYPLSFQSSDVNNIVKLDELKVNNVVLYSNKENGLCVIDKTIYVINDLIMLNEGCSSMKSSALIFVDLKGNLVNKFTGWEDNGLKYGIDDMTGTVNINLSKKDNYITIEFPFTSVTEGYGLDLIKPVDEFQNMPFDSNYMGKIGITNQTTIDGKAVLKYNKNNTFGEVEILTKNTYSDYIKINESVLNNHSSLLQ